MKFFNKQIIFKNLNILNSIKYSLIKQKIIYFNSSNNFSFSFILAISFGSMFSII